MGKLQELIERYCPDGVVYRQFGDIGQYIRGVTYSKHQEVDSGIEGAQILLRANNIDLATNKLCLDELKYVSPDVVIKDTQHLKAGDIFICAGSGSKAHIGKVAYIEEDSNYAFGGFMAALRRIDDKAVDGRYLFYCFTSGLFSSHLDRTLQSSTINNLKAAIVNSFRIPVPPIEVQREIVRLLDAYTAVHDALVTKLKLESDLFSNYFAMSIDQRFDSISTVSNGSLASICENISDCPHSTAPDEGEGYPLIRTPNIGKGNLILDGVHRVSKDVYEKRTLRAVPKPGDLILAREGNVGNVAIIPEGELVCLGQRTVLIQPDLSKVYPPYLCMLLNTSTLQTNLLKRAAGSTVMHINMSDIRNLVVSLPPLDAQKQVFTSLEDLYYARDAMFSVLKNELDLRHKQLVEFRNQLMSFPEKSE